MVDVLLVQPPLPESMSEYVKEVVFCPPLGLGYLASTLIQANIDVMIVDMAVTNMSEEELKSKLYRYRPKVVGITTSTFTYKNALKIARISKNLDPRPYIVLGGPHVTFTAENTLKNQEVDIVVRQEGEVTLPELTVKLLNNDMQLQHIKGISYRDNDKVVKNSDRPLIKNLDNLPYPSRDLFSTQLYKVLATIITSRGCPANCIYCSAGALSGGCYRIRSPDNVFNEIKQMLVQFGLDYFFIADDTFPIFRERTIEICRKIRELNFKIGWSCEARVNSISRDMISEMANSGCVCIHYGVESGSQKILDSIWKGITVEQVKKAVQWSIDAGIMIYCTFMMPFPEDTIESLKETEKFMIELKKIGAHLILSLSTPFPGTYMCTHAEELGISILSNDTDDYNFATPLFTTRHLSIEKIEETFNRLNSMCDKTLIHTTLT